MKKLHITPKSPKPGGFIASAFTPLNEDGKLDLDRVREYYAYLKLNGIEGVLICSNYEDGFLSIEEKADLAYAWASASSGDDKFTVLQLIRENSVQNIKHLVRNAAELKLCGVVIGPPTGEVWQTVESITTLFQWYFQDIPKILFYCEYSDQSACFSMMDLLKNMEKQFTVFSGFWYRGQNLRDLLSCLRYKEGKFDLLWDSDNFFLPVLSLGIKVATGIQFNYLATLYHQLIAAFKDNDQMLMHQLEDTTSDFFRTVQNSGTGSAKACMKLVGMDCGPNKFPIADQKDDHLRDLFSDLMGLHFYLHKSKELKGKKWMKA